MGLVESGFKFVQATTTLIFDEVENSRSNVDSFDKELADYFQTPGIVNAVGQGVDPNVPRLRYQSKFGHSVLQISNLSAQMITNLDAEYATNFDKVSAYCKEREASLEKVISHHKVAIKWIGCSIKAQKVVGTPKQPDQAPITLLKSKFFRDEAFMSKTEPVQEMAQKIAFIEKSRFFLNFHASNFKSFTKTFPAKAGQPIRLVNIPLREFDFIEQGIELVLDVNSKYGYDMVPGHQHSQSDFDEILALTKDFIANKLGRITW